MTAGIALRSREARTAHLPAPMSEPQGHARLGELLPRDRKPLYAQFAQLLRRAITEGRLEAGTALPPERD
ncbi:GntR family transcriptional regulator, partial [Escherichia coli]|nr:GntR family transcriptional regulator [Escherichia coli]